MNVELYAVRKELMPRAKAFQERNTAMEAYKTVSEYVILHLTSSVATQ